MVLSKEYLDEQKDTIKRAWIARKLYQNTTRLLLFREFNKNFSKTLDAGCGPYAPFVTCATHAMDVVPEPEAYLRGLGWRGEFKVGSVTDMPYPSDFFDAAICSEVIEHLETLEEVYQTFSELNEVARRWIVTTPCNPLGPLNTEPIHKRAFSFLELKTFAFSYDAKIYKDAIYYYVVKDGSGTFARIFAKYNLKVVSG